MPEGLKENISCRPALNPSASLVSVDNVKKSKSSFGIFPKFSLLSAAFKKDAAQGYLTRLQCPEKKQIIRVALVYSHNVRYSTFIVN